MQEVFFFKNHTENRARRLQSFKKYSRQTLVCETEHYGESLGVF